MNKTTTPTVHLSVCYIGVAREEEIMFMYSRYNKYTSNLLCVLLIRVMFLVLAVPSRY